MRLLLRQRARGLDVGNSECGHAAGTMRREETEDVGFDPQFDAVKVLPEYGGMVAGNCFIDVAVNGKNLVIFYHNSF